MSASIEELPVLDDARYIPMLVLGCISSFLSFLGSSCMLYMTSKSARQKILHRILLGLSVADLTSSVALFFMPFSAPSFLGLAGAVGNHVSCSAAGFFLTTFSMVGCCYNCYLSLYYMLSVRRNWREHDFKSWMEIPAYAFAFLVPIAISAAAVVTENINPQVLLNNTCLYSTFPWYCEEGNCDRGIPAICAMAGQAAALFLFAFSMLGFTCAGMVFCTVRSTLKKSMSHNFSGNRDLANEERIQQVAIQSGLYSLAYFNTFIWPVLAVILSDTRVIPYEELMEKRLETPLYIVQVLYWTLYPLQGFLNFFIFTRQKRMQWRQAEPDMSLFWTYKQIMLSSPLPGISSSALSSRVMNTSRQLANLDTTGHTSANGPSFDC